MRSESRASRWRGDQLGHRNRARARLLPSMVVAGLGFLWIVFDEDRQALHDKIAGTLVVRTGRQESIV
jgi:uncharacterized RDD family membrane protein YckC